MLTMNADAHPLMSLMHKPEVDPETGVVLPPEKQDKRTIVLLEREHWDTWLYGTNEAALQPGGRRATRRVVVLAEGPHG